MSIAGRGSIAAMLASLLYLVLLRLLTLVAPNHRSGDTAEIEILVLRHQLGILRRQVKRLLGQLGLETAPERTRTPRRRRVH